MIFKFKFNLGQEVFPAKSRNEVAYKNCEECAGVGHFAAAERPDLSVSCPGCRGDKKRAHQRRLYWYVGSTLNISQCRVEITDPETDHFRHPAVEEQYMCRETGTYSGSIHKAAALFATRTEAEAWCEAENARIEWVPYK